jgi:hypothetical protein
MRGPARHFFSKTNIDAEPNDLIYVIFVNNMKETRMPTIISAPAQAIENIIRFEGEVRKSSELQSRLPYARAWYAFRDGKGAWRFGPSKFIGYVDLDAEAYLRTAQETDGRRTEAQLQCFFELVEPTDPRFPELSSALVTFLAKYDKAPSIMARISIAGDLHGRFFSSKGPTPNDLSNMLLRHAKEIARILPTQHLQELRDQIDEIREG